MPTNRCPLASTTLFHGITENEAQAMLGCLGAQEQSFDKGQRILRMGDQVRELGLVLCGSVRIESTDAWGNTVILSHKGKGQVFAEDHACAPNAPLLADVVAAQDCTVLMVDVSRLVRTCPSTCSHHGKMLANLLAILASSNIDLADRARITAPKSIREKALAYLSLQSKRARAATFEIPFTRQQMADYLGVDRSALSAELSKMQREGLIMVERSWFTLMVRD